MKGALCVKEVVPHRGVFVLSQAENARFRCSFCVKNVMTPMRSFAMRLWKLLNIAEHIIVCSGLYCVVVCTVVVCGV